jgi:hypothetical protein
MTDRLMDRWTNRKYKNNMSPPGWGRQNHGSQGSDRATMGKTIFTCVYIGKIFQKFSSQ